MGEHGLNIQICRSICDPIVLSEFSNFLFDSIPNHRGIRCLHPENYIYFKWIFDLIHSNNIKMEN